jgi:hypothetical protein
MKNYLAILIIVLGSLGSCQKIVDAEKLLDAEEQVYIRGYIAPQDTLFRIHVSKVLPAVGTTFSFDDWEANRQKFIINNAEVILSDEAGNSTTLQYDADEGNYTADGQTLNIMGEQRYFLEVTVEGLSYSATCVIPKAIPIENVDYDVIPTTYEFGRDPLSGVLSFQDFSEEGNVYALGGTFEWTYTYGDEPQQIIESNMGVENFEPFLNDNLDNGGILSARLFSNAFYDEETEIDSVEVTLKVAHIDEIIYQNIRANDNNQDAEFDIFLEYSVAPNNVLDEGAVGIFAGYNLTEKKIIVNTE